MNEKGREILFPPSRFWTASTRNAPTKTGTGNNLLMEQKRSDLTTRLAVEGGIGGSMPPYRLGQKQEKADSNAAVGLFPRIDKKEIPSTQQGYNILPKSIGAERADATAF